MKKSICLIIAFSLFSGIGLIAGGQQEGGGLKLTASDGYDERGYMAEMTLTIVDNVIMEVAYDEFKKDGKDSKSLDAALNKKMNDESGVSWKEAVFKLVTQLRRTGDPRQVDAVSGATSLSARFTKLASEALESR